MPTIIRGTDWPVAAKVRRVSSVTKLRCKGSTLTAIGVDFGYSFSNCLAIPSFCWGPR